MVDVHDLHIWTLDGQNAILTAHLVGEEHTSPDDLRALHRRIDEYDVRVRQAGAVVSLGLGAVAAAMVVG